jgi:hypothetical protein
MPLIPALGGRGRQISEFEASLVYRVSSRTARAIQRNPVCLEKPKKKKKKKKSRCVCVSFIYGSEGTKAVAGSPVHPEIKAG